MSKGCHRAASVDLCPGYGQSRLARQSRNTSLDAPFTYVCPPETFRRAPQSHQTALFDFTAREEDELSFVVGDEIIVIERIEGGWWQGQLSDVVGASR